MRKTLLLALVGMSLCAYQSTAQNIALAKNATASSTYAINPANQANDNSGSTLWASDVGEDQWLAYDMAATHNFTSVTINWTNQPAADFTIETSVDNVTWTVVGTVTGNSASTNTVPISGSGRYIRLHTSQSISFGAYGVYEFQVFGSIASALGANIALGKTAIASSESFPATNVTDGQGDSDPGEVDYVGQCGSNCSVWQSGGNGTEWVYVDLGAPTSLRQTIIYWGFFRASDFQVQVSNDAATWNTVHTMTGNYATQHTFDLTGSTARYVRVLSTVPNAGNPAYVIFEIQLYGFGTLPVSLSSFAAVKQNEDAKISWTTAQELNSREFIVQRSADGRSWTELTRVAAQGNTQSTTNYSVTDNNPGKGVNYYNMSANNFSLFTPV
ncbi:MAG: discoidin domain-containing protein, partial [Pedobacter sp.]